MASPFLRRGRLGIAILVLQLIFIVLFAITTDYEPAARPSDAMMAVKVVSNDTAASSPAAKAAPGAYTPGSIEKYYGMFQDVHVMIFIGFGFLMTFLKRYGFSSVGLNMLLASIAIQWAMLVGGFIHGHGKQVEVGMTTLLTADFAAASVLITFGALLGKVSGLQLVVICILEIVIFCGNEYVGLAMLQVSDVGGSMFVHAFGAYFGLAVSKVLTKDDMETRKEGSVYHSDIFAMIGTVFLWLFWPSFNSALAQEDAQHRAIINTYLALAACSVVSFAISSLVDKRGKFDMVHIQNATLAGGVAVGTSADMMIGTHGALLIGAIAGVLSVIGYKYITPFLHSKLKIHDTCGVHNLHGMPAVMAAIAGSIASLMASTDNYGYTLYRQFPARAPAAGAELDSINRHSGMSVGAGPGRTAAQQAGYQMAALGLTLVVAILGGLLVGAIVRFVPLGQLGPDSLFDDEENWEVPEDDKEDHDGPRATASPLLVTKNGGDLETAFTNE